MTATSAAPTIKRRLVTGGRLAGGSGGSGLSRALCEQPPDAPRDGRDLLAQGRLLELPGPLRGAGADHDSAAQPVGHERWRIGVAARGGDPARARRHAPGLLELGEVADELVEAGEQPEPVLEHR